MTLVAHENHFHYEIDRLVLADGEQRFKVVQVNTDDGSCVDMPKTFDWFEDALQEADRLNQTRVVTRERVASYKKHEWDEPVRGVPGVTGTGGPSHPYPDVKTGDPHPLSQEEIRSTYRHRAELGEL